jgi:hypothetical protein
MMESTLSLQDGFAPCLIYVTIWLDGMWVDKISPKVSIKKE